MMQKIFSTLIIIFVIVQTQAQLVINELSQGIGTAEYAELVVVGTKTCSDSTINIQGWIIDDNCGFYGGDGIAAGNIRFSTDPQWASVKYGSIILVYNDGNIYPGIIADETDANGDDVYILPSNSSFFETNSTVPAGGAASAIATYTSTGYSAGGTIWDALGMRNAGDAFHTVSPTNLSASFHSVGWGSATATTDVYFPGSASGKSMVNTNAVSNDFTNQANWDTIPQALGTPGVANSVNNLAWINAMKAPATNCDFCISDATLWVKGDTGTLNGLANVSSGTVTEWENLVPNVNIPSLIASGTPQLVQNLPAFNFNSAMFFTNDYFRRENLLNDALLDPNQGSMFVVSTTAGLSFNFAIDGPSTGTCGGNRCSSGYRGNRTEYGSANNFFAGATNVGIANVLSMTANDITNQHFNSINGVESIGAAVTAIPPQAVPYSVSIARWPGYTMNNQYVAEALAFNRELTQNEVYQVETYLAIKYGVSIAHNYVNSTNTDLWTVGNGFDHNITGISRDDCFGLEQIKSKSVHPNASLTIALTDNGGTFANPNNFTNDLASLSWGNDNNALTFTCSTNTPNSHNLLLGRNWLTETSGIFGNVSMSFDLTPFTGGYTASDIALVIDVNQNGLYSDDVAILPNSIVGNELFFDNVSLTDSLMFSLVSIGPYINDTISETICDTDSFLFAGNYYYTLGFYTDTVTCDTIRTLNLNVQVCANCAMDLGNDTIICGAVNYTLDAGVFDEYLWQDASTNQTFTATGTGQYYCQGTNFDTTNLVVNPDFQAGAVNFTTDYNPGSGGPWGLLSNAGEYAISTSSSLVHNNFQNCLDHTTGTGNMMIVNGSNLANQAVWCQTIPVNMNTDYYFSIWAISVENTNAANVASLFFEINGSQIGTNFNPSFTSCDWQQYNETWNSGANTSAVLCVYNNTSSGNNDFAIDDIFFGEACIVSDTIDILGQPNNVDSLAIEICSNDSALIFGNYETMAGLYEDTLVSSLGCDSVYRKRLLTVNVSLSSTNDTSICFSDSIFLEGAWQNATNTYYDTLSNSSSCDSLVITNLTVSSAPISDTTQTCSNILADAGINIVDTLFTNSGCDSIYNYLNTIYQAIDSVTNTSCTDDPLLAQNNIDTALNTLGCDSFYTTTEITYSAPVTNVLIDSCTNNPMNALNMIDTISTFNGCDSIYNLSTVTYINPDTTILAQLCTNNLALSGTNYMNTNSVSGCDSFTIVQETVYIQLDTLELPALSICIGESEVIFGNTQTQSGTFSELIISDLGCDSLRREQTLTVNPLPIVSAGQDTTITEGDNVILIATGANTYNWSTGESSSILDLTLDETTTFSVLGIDANNCEGMDSVTVFVLEEQIILAVPTGFSPNADGVNDVFRIVNENLFENITMRVYNRWGEMVFVNDKNNKSWDGTYKNVDQPIDNYVYYIEATLKKTKEKFNVSGSISLIR